MAAVRKKTLSTLVGAAVLAAVLLILFLASTFVVSENEQAIKLQFGKRVGGTISEPGLHFKVPLIQDVRYFDKRLLSWDGDPTQVPTKGREFILVDATARWRIVDPLKFLQTVRNEQGALSRLDDIIDSAVRDEVSNLLLVEIVRSQDWDPTQVDEDRLLTSNSGPDDNEQSLSVPIRVGREGLTRRILEAASGPVDSIGVELVDVRLRRINYVESVRIKVYERMISERQRIAAQFRSEGEGLSLAIRGATERQLQAIESEARRLGEVIMGRGDAAAAKIYAEAFSAAPEFYNFQRRLESYERTLGSGATLLLGTDSDYFTGLGHIGEAEENLADLNIEERLRAVEDAANVEGVETPPELGLDLPLLPTTGGQAPQIPAEPEPTSEPTPPTE